MSHAPAPDLTPEEAVKVAAFGLDRPEVAEVREVRAQEAALNAQRATFDEDAFLSAHAGLGDADYQDWYDAFIEESPRVDPLFLVHHAGPDDIYPARSWREAVGFAHELNAGTVTYTRRTKHDGLVRSWATPYLLADAIAAGVVAPTQNLRKDGQS